MGIFDFLLGPYIEFPARASGERLREGVAVVSKCIELERKNRGADVRWRRRSTPINDSQAEGQSEPNDTAISPEPRDAQGYVDDFCKSYSDIVEQPRTPNLKAKTLSFAAQLLLFVQQKCNGVGAVAYKRAGVSRKTYSKIISDARKYVSKRTVMQFAIGLQLSRAEADVLLKSAGYAFAETIPEDVAFLYCIDHAIWNLYDLNAILRECKRDEIPLPSSYRCRL